MMLYNYASSAVMPTQFESADMRAHFIMAITIMKSQLRRIFRDAGLMSDTLQPIMAEQKASTVSTSTSDTQHDPSSSLPSGKTSPFEAPQVPVDEAMADAVRHKVENLTDMKPVILKVCDILPPGRLRDKIIKDKYIKLHPDSTLTGYSPDGAYRYILNDSLNKRIRSEFSVNP